MFPRFTKDFVIVKLGNTGVFVIISLILLLLFIDKSIVPLSVYTGGIKSSAYDLGIFTVISLICFAGQVIILKYVNMKFPNSIRWMRLCYKMVVIVQYSLIAIQVSIIIEMIITTSYSAILLKTCIWMNYIMLIFFLGLLSHRFFLWYRSQRNNIIIMYGIATAILSASGLVAILFMDQQFSGEQRGIDYVKPHPHIIGMTVIVDTTIPTLYEIMSSLSFVSFWVATAVLLRHHAKHLGILRYWIFVSLPLIYFLSQYQSLIISLFYSIRVQDPALFGVLYTLIFTGTKPIGGFLFALAFWSIARNVDSQVIKFYAMISAYGTMLLFTSNQPSGLGMIPYPPFGIPTISFLGLSSFLVLVGIYSSAVSMSNDTEIHRSIVKSVSNQSSMMLHEIGTAERQEQLQKRVLKLTQKFAEQLEDETGIESSLEEEDIKSYLAEVMKEVHPEE